MRSNWKGTIWILSPKPDDSTEETEGNTFNILSVKGLGHLAGLTQHQLDQFSRGHLAAHVRSFFCSELASGELCYEYKGWVWAPQTVSDWSYWYMKSHFLRCSPELGSYLSHPWVRSALSRLGPYSDTAGSNIQKSSWSTYRPNPSERSLKAECATITHNVKHIKHTTQLHTYPTQSKHNTPVTNTNRVGVTL